MVNEQIFDAVSGNRNVLLKIFNEDGSVIFYYFYL